MILYDAFALLVDTTSPTTSGVVIGMRFGVAVKTGAAVKIRRRRQKPAPRQEERCFFEKDRVLRTTADVERDVENQRRRGRHFRSSGRGRQLISVFGRREDGTFQPINMDVKTNDVRTNDVNTNDIMMDEIG